MLKAGARGFLPKESTLDEIKKAFDLVLQQKTYLSQNFIEILAGQVSTDNTLNPFEILSHREFEIVNLLLSGLSINAIAQTLNLKPSTVGTYKIRVFEKLKIKSVFELKDLAMLFNFNHHSIDY
jgi:two-component system, NarL family, invasion response regulator UvrY